MKIQHSIPLLIKAGNYGRNDIFLRTPELKPLQNKKVLVIGLGCLGAPSALDLARCGIGNLTVMDHDTVDPDTTCRWPLGLSVAGWPKTKAIEQHINENYPYCKVAIENHRIGGDAIDRDEKRCDYTNLEKAMDEVDLIYDASAELGVNRFISDLALEEKIPYIKVSGSYGMWGGEVMRVVPDTTDGCFMCFLHQQDKEAINIPNARPNDDVQAVGCGNLTFTGTSFDANIIAMTGVRLAVSTLLIDEEAYPDVDWDIAIINLRNSTGTPISPTFETHKLTRYIECKNH